MPYVLIGYLTFLNIVGFAVCTADKRAAIKHKRRVSERTLFVLALLGGPLGVWLAMLIFHHKTRKLRFAVFMPVIALAYAALACLLLRQ
jgi:uncharacterized membrane protein YsdA (DUF1294 family)